MDININQNAYDFHGHSNLICKQNKKSMLCYYILSLKNHVFMYKVAHTNFALVWTHQLPIANEL